MGDSWIFLSVILPLVLLFISIRPWMKYVVRMEMGGFRDKVSGVEGRLSALEGRFQDWIPFTQKIAERLMESPSNPDGRRQELLSKWKAGTLTYDEPLELRDILAKEAEGAEEKKKNLVSLGLLALFIYALSRKK